MSEIFKLATPAQPQVFTGERLTSEVSGQIQVEHYHRYFLAREYCRGKDVLDIASGEGYGSALLAQTARSVVGVEIDADTVAHARDAYPGPRFLVGSTTSIPIEDASVDIVVSFETLEHFYDHDAFMKEVRRVLRPEGMLILSTPDRDLYFPPTGVNQYHVNELTRVELEALLGRFFLHRYLYFQRAVLGSVLILDPSASASGAPIVFERRNDTYYEQTVGMPRAPYIIAFASDAPLSMPSATVYVERSEPYSHITQMEQSLRAAEVAFHSEEARLRDEHAAVETAFHSEEARLRNEFAAAETAFHSEEARLRNELAHAINQRHSRTFRGRISGALHRILSRGKQ